MEGLFLLAKINWAFQIVEKVAYGIMALYGASIAKRYYSDYKDSVEDEKINERISNGNVR